MGTFDEASKDKTGNGTELAERFGQVPDGIRLGRTVQMGAGQAQGSGQAKAHANARGSNASAKASSDQTASGRGARSSNKAQANVILNAPDHTSNLAEILSRATAMAGRRMERERSRRQPPAPGVSLQPEFANSDKPGVGDVLVTPVREGAQDNWSRFEGASAAIGHFIRMVHEGRMSKDEGWEGICGYNAAEMDPGFGTSR